VLLTAYPLIGLNTGKLACTPLLELFPEDGSLCRNM